MKLRNGNRFEIDVAKDEKITVQITQSTGIADLVNYSQDGGSAPGPLPVNAPCGVKFVKTGNLAVTAHFTDPGGGNFTTQVTGSSGGDTSTFPFNQATGEPFKTLVYTFFVKA